MNILNGFLKPLPILALILLSGSGSAMAQQCEINPEAIFKLHKSDIGAYAIWYGVHGDDSHEERYVDGVMLEHGHVALSGTRSEPGKPYPDLILVEVDRRGRVVWEAKRNVKGLYQVLSTEVSGKDIVVSALVKEGRDTLSYWVGVFDQRGALRVEKVFRHKDGSVVYGDVIAANKGGGLTMVLSTKDKRSGVPRFSGFYRLNNKLQVISKRDFKPGPDNGMYNIIPTPDGQYLLSGYIDNERGRKNGWIMKLNNEGAIIWQQQYPRGIGGEFVKASVMPDGSYIVLGTALPAQENSLKAGWVMNISSDNGTVHWQRYFTGKLDYTGKDVLISKDGLVSALLEAKNVKGFYDEEGEKPKDYMRLMTLSPRGVIFDSQAYFQGEIASADNMFLGPAQERIMVGYTQIAYQKDEVNVAENAAEEAVENSAENTEKVTEVKMAGKPIVKRSDEGWVVAAPRAKPYEDPCKPKRQRDLEGL